MASEIQINQLPKKMTQRVEKIMRTQRGNVFIYVNIALYGLL